MKKYTLYVGLNDKNTKTQMIDTLEATKIVQNLTADYFGGCTIYNATGVFKHDDGSIVLENTLRIEVFTEQEKRIKILASNLKSILNQESIIIQTEAINTQLF